MKLSFQSPLTKSDAQLSVLTARELHRELTKLWQFIQRHASAAQRLTRRKESALKSRDLLNLQDHARVVRSAVDDYSRVCIHYRFAKGR